MAESFYPKDPKDYYEDLIDKKRSLVEMGETDWTSESPGDYGIISLMLISYALSKSDKYYDNRLKQVFAQNARSPEAIVDAVRGLGYRIRGPVPAVMYFTVTSKESTEVSVGDRFAKDMDTGETVVFEAAEKVAFDGVETKQVQVVQGEVKSVTKTGTGKKYQKVFFNHSNVASGYTVIQVQDNETGATYAYTLVDNFARSGSTDTHCLIERHYDGTPVVIFGDGLRGMAPPKNSTITVWYRICDGELGNISSGDVRLITRNSAIESVESNAPDHCLLANAIQPDDTEITVEDDGSIDAFPDSGYLYINYDEQVSYNGKSGATFQNVTGLEKSFSAGTVVTYTNMDMYGRDFESAQEMKASATNLNRIKTCGGTELDLAFLATRINGVARAYAYQIGPTTFVEVVPYHGGAPSQELVDEVEELLNDYTTARTILEVTGPKYVYVDAALKVTPVPGVSWGSVEEKVDQVVERYLSPVSITYNQKFFASDWGREIRKDELTYLLYRRLGGRYIAGFDYLKFCRSLEDSSVEDVITLAPNEITNVGDITIQQDTITKDYSTLLSYTEGAE